MKMGLKTIINYVIPAFINLFVIYFLCYFSIGTKEDALSIYAESPTTMFLGKFAFSTMFTTIIMLILIAIISFISWIIIKGNKHCFYIANALLISLSVIISDKFVNIYTSHSVLNCIIPLSFSLFLGYLLYVSRYFIRKGVDRIQHISFKQITRIFGVNFLIICIESFFVLLFKLYEYGYV